MVDVDSFQAAFAEFSTASRAVITSTITAVELRVSASYGAIRDEVVMLEVADTLSVKLNARNARTQKDSKGDKGSIYARKLDELKTAHALTRRVAGVPR